MNQLVTITKGNNKRITCHKTTGGEGAVINKLNRAMAICAKMSLPFDYLTNRTPLLLHEKNYG